MSGTRITHKLMGQRSLQGLQHNLGNMGRLQQQLSSGKQISRPSDSPSGTVSALRLRSEIRTTEQYSRNAHDGLGWLGTIDNTLTDALASIKQVRALTLQGMNDPSAAGRPALAMEVDKLRDGLIDLANVQYLDRPVFGGTTTSSVAYDRATATFVGDTNPVERTVGDDARVRVDANGPAVFGAGPANLFAIVQDIAADLAADPAALGGHLTRLDAADKALQERLADVGARYNRIDQMRSTADDRVGDLRTSLSEVEDIDLPKTIVELQMQETAYHAALGATKRVIVPSLVDFLS